MKIGIESQRIFRHGKHGMDVVAMELIRELQQIDSENSYVIYAKDGPDKSSVTESRSLKIELVKGFTYGDWEQISLPAAIKKTKPDLLHCTANTAPINCRVPLVLTLHDVIFLGDSGFKGSAYQNFGNLYRKWIAPPAIKKAKTIITVSEFEKSVIAEKCNIDPQKIKVIYNAVSKKFRKIDEYEVERFRRKYNLPEKFILHLGNTAPKKNTYRVIEAFTEYFTAVKNSLPLVIADFPKTSIINYLESKSNPGVIPYIYTPGYISSNEMPLLYNAASLFLYPSLQESFGLPLLEAMACEVPVITSGIPALKEIGADAAEYIDPTDTNGIAESISTLLNDKDRQEQLIRNGIVRAAQFSWKRSAEQLLQVYRETI